MERVLEKSGNFVSPGKWEPWFGGDISNNELE